MANYITQNFLPVKVHIKEHPAWFHRFDVLWTPTALILDAGGVERFRSEGYLPRPEFRAQLAMGLARVDFMYKKFAEADRRYDEIIREHSNTSIVPEAMYWKWVSRYKNTNDHTVLGEAAKELKQYGDSLWAKKASISAT